MKTMTSECRGPWRNLRASVNPLGNVATLSDGEVIRLTTERKRNAEISWRREGRKPSRLMAIYRSDRIGKFSPLHKLIRTFSSLSDNALASGRVVDGPFQHSSHKTKSIFICSYITYTCFKHSITPPERCLSAASFPGSDSLGGSYFNICASVTEANQSVNQPCVTAHGHVFFYLGILCRRIF